MTLTCRTPSSTSRVSPQNPALNPASIGQLATGDWVCQSRPLCLAGDSGTGKTHLLIDPGTAVGERGHSVRYVLAAKLVKSSPKSTVAIASNERFSGWTKTFTNPRLCAAIVDRLTYNGHIIENGTPPATD